MDDDAEHTGMDDPRRIAVVGPCASGKSTLVENLVNRGYRAYAVAQEHSIIRDLWSKRNPDILIALDVSLDVVRQRRTPGWSAEIYKAQHERLRPAFEAADLVIDTGARDAEEVLRMSVDLIRSTGDRSA
jgi:Ni2+-binding GTPase involved in maturation of urease and hydrogenase